MTRLGNYALVTYFSMIVWMDSVRCYWINAFKMVIAMT